MRHPVATPRRATALPGRGRAPLEAIEDAGDVAVMRGAWAVRVHRECEDGFRAGESPIAWR